MYTCIWLFKYTALQKCYLNTCRIRFFSGIKRCYDHFSRRGSLKDITLKLVSEGKQVARCYRSSHRRCSIKKTFLKISQNSQRSTCIGVPFLIKLQASCPQLYFKKRLRHMYFPVSFVKFLRTPFLQSIYGLLHLLLD